MRYLQEIARSVPKLAPPKCRHDKIPWRGEYLAEGVDGKAYQNWEEEDKVVKVGFLDHAARSGSSLSKLEDNFDFVLVNQPEAYVKVYDYGCFDCKSCNISYFVMMEKLEKLSQKESSEIPFFAINAQALMSKRKKHSTDQVDFLKRASNPKKKSFAENIWKSGLFHNDIHAGNIMKDINGNYKLIDLDRLTFIK